VGLLDMLVRAQNYGCVYNVGNINSEKGYKGNLVGKKSSYASESDVVLDGVYYFDNGLEAIGNKSELTQNEYIKSITEMKTQSTFSEFDFENTWEITENRFPTLKSSNNVYVSQINADDVQVEIGKEKQIQLSFLPEIADDAVFKYSIDNEEIATVSSEGMVHGLKEGNTTINIKTVDENISKMINLTVIEERTLTGISVKNIPTDVNYFVGDTLNTEGLILTLTYDNGDTEEITEGFVCSPTTLNTEGEQEITVSYEGQVATFTVTVNKNIIKGDVNSDNVVDFMDILAINKHRLGKAQLTGECLTAADVNEDGNIDFMDILQINKYRLGKIDSL